MKCDIRDPYILKAMGRACSQVLANKGYIGEMERQDIADRILAGASAGETSIEKLVAFAVTDLAGKEDYASSNHFISKLYS